MIERARALVMVKKRLPTANLVKHLLATEAVMGALARRLSQEESVWGLTGLLHDLDYAQTVDDESRHGYLTAQELEGELPPESLRAIIAHPSHIPAQTPIDWALYCSDPVTGLITAAALTHPSRSLAELPLNSVVKRFKDKRFAAGASREQILCCSKLGLELEEFLGLALNAMRGISGELGL